MLLFYTRKEELPVADQNLAMYSHELGSILGLQIQQSQLDEILNTMIYFIQAESFLISIRFSDHSESQVWVHL